MSRAGDGRRKFRYRWNHRSPIHRIVVRAANRILPLVPHPVKYAVTDALRRGQQPYRLLVPGSVAIQVGAPRDTLRAGRSRAMAFARRTRAQGQLLVVEPDRASVEEFQRVARRRGFDHIEVVHAAAWSERTTLTMRVDPGHPATNFTAGCATYSTAEVARFQEICVEALPIDDLVDRAGLDRVDVVSITTNGAEEEILRGLRRTIERFRPYICLAHTRGSYTALMDALGYELMGQDDRGFTFRHRQAEPAGRSPVRTGHG
ncbi:FkbM family methyltransferase [Solwaraspora sp. WMMD1047]|uniref:FkbM family methyltransferase n=1 Tax=Solwaraspora sp. WMMD1047 TaxID=3016102 RepID=UPI002417EDCF|nr:FkbM family methyltransferase [Solwaraspora sp. WMMD1047]MDG4831445.1 FkbM family methyltransferase [Solwaraspora sp. WMMD1047]